MFDIFPLNIFPQGSLSSSVITTVWVGVFVIAFFNLRFGWVLSGLVVPGYLVPLMLVKPWSAGVVIIEGFVTYFIVWFYSEYLSRWCRWNNFFGRDRFFALILCSIVVRVSFDGWLLPMLGDTLQEIWHFPFDYRNNLHSFGLIMVALIGNQLWKTGMVRGLPPFFITLFITYVIIRFGLMELTNFSISSLGYLYEDMAASILASPKAYIILVSAAFMASRMNLHYGWDYNGILIPSLLALQWYQPMKILATMVEAGVILILANSLLKLPIFKNATIEGARKLLLFFNISFAYKMVLGYSILWLFPQVKVTDSYGFGYLLATLMALKIHDKDILPRLSRAILQTSLSAVVLASVIGFGLTFLPRSNVWTENDDVSNQPVPQPELKGSLHDVFRNQRVVLYESSFAENFAAPLPGEIDSFTRALESAKRYVASRDVQELKHISSHLEKINYQVKLVQNRYLYISEKPPVRGWGIYIVDTESNSQLTIEVPAPLDERGTVDAGFALFNTLDAKALAIAGTLRNINADRSGDVLQTRQSLFQSFHRSVNRHDVLQVRGYTSERARKLGGIRRAKTQLEIAGLSSVLWIKERPPGSLNLVELRSMLDDFKVEWGSSPFINTQREASRWGFAELVLNAADLRKALFKSLKVRSEVPFVEQNLSIDGYLQEWLLDGKGEMAEKGSDLYVVPKPEELLFFDQEVLTPLFHLVRSKYRGSAWTDDGLDELNAIANAAAVFGYGVVRYRHRRTGQNYLILAESGPLQTRRYWGTYVIRLSESRNYVVQIPRPLYEINSFEYAVTLFERIQAKVLMVAGTHPLANRDRSSDLIDFHNKINFFNLFNQVFLREEAGSEFVVIQSRAFAIRPDQPFPNSDVLLALGRGIGGKPTTLESKLVQAIRIDGLSVQSVDGSIETAGYEVAGGGQALYLNSTRNKHFIGMWLSPLARSGYRQQSENKAQEAQFRMLDIPNVDGDLYVEVGAADQWTASELMPKALRDELELYLVNYDIILLYRIRVQWPEYQFKRIVDANSRQAFLSVSDRSAKVISVMNLLPRSQRLVAISETENLNSRLAEFIESRATWLEWGSY